MYNSGSPQYCPRPFEHTAHGLSKPFDDENDDDEDNDDADDDDENIDGDDGQW